MVQKLYYPYKSDKAEKKSCGTEAKGSKCCAGKGKKAETSTKEATPAI